MFDILSIVPDLQSLFPQDLYFERHDGHAVTCDDFLRAMENANDEDLSVLSRYDSVHPTRERYHRACADDRACAFICRWYSQAGTPRLTVSTTYDASAKTFVLRVQQHTPPTLGQAEKQPVLIPLAVGLLDPEGKEMPLKLQVPLPFPNAACSHSREV
jgi:aminopeptidase N